MPTNEEKIKIEELPEAEFIEVTNLQKQIIETFMAQIGEAKKSLTDLDQAMIRQAAKDAAQLQARSILRGEDVSKELRIVNATLLNLSVAAYLPIKTAFWNAAQNAVSVLATVIMKAALAAV